MRILRIRISFINYHIGVFSAVHRNLIIFGILFIFFYIRYTQQMTQCQMQSLDLGRRSRTRSSIPSRSSGRAIDAQNIRTVPPTSNTLSHDDTVGALCPDQYSPQCNPNTDQPSSNSKLTH